MIKMMIFASVCCLHEENHFSFLKILGSLFYQHRPENTSSLIVVQFEFVQINQKNSSCLILPEPQLFSRTKPSSGRTGTQQQQVLALVQFDASRWMITTAGLCQDEKWR
ncbi:hypothetical protein ILYODFUR_026487 [Ilyodon furcidens]|uniref:Uncharacterized protein n=1 Tax=Ilyodon furcidens TaxID=33524 RepID=A0ABV0T2M9_9TELE